MSEGPPGATIALEYRCENYDGSRGDPLTNVLLTAFSNRHDAVELASTAAASLRELGIATTFFNLGEGTPSLDASTLVVSLGGDGTFLKSARIAHAHGARILAVNLGRIGFLLDVPADEIVSNVVAALDNDDAADRLALEITFESSPGTSFAFNEVVVERKTAGHMVRVTTFVDGEEFLTYSADGVLVSTPTGSTGYNFSAGGPVVDATLHVMVLTPVAPHFTIDRSIVVDSEKVVRLVATDKPALVVADSNVIGTLQPGDAVLVRQSPNPVRVVRSRSFEMGFRLRESLREGHA